MLNPGSCHLLKSACLKQPSLLVFTDVATRPAGFREVAGPDGCGPQLQQLSTSSSPVTRMRVLSLALSLAAASSSHATAIHHSGKGSSPQAHTGPCWDHTAVHNSTPTTVYCLRQPADMLPMLPAGLLSALVRELQERTDTLACLAALTMLSELAEQSPESMSVLASAMLPQLQQLTQAGDDLVKGQALQVSW